MFRSLLLAPHPEEPCGVIITIVFFFFSNLFPCDSFVKEMWVVVCAATCTRTHASPLVTMKSACGACIVELHAAALRSTSEQLITRICPGEKKNKKECTSNRHRRYLMRRHFKARAVSTPLRHRPAHHSSNPLFLSSSWMRLCTFHTTRQRSH